MKAESQKMDNFTNAVLSTLGKPSVGIACGFGSGLAWLAGQFHLIAPYIADIATLGGAILVWIHVYRALKGKDK